MLEKLKPVLSGGFAAAVTLTLLWVMQDLIRPSGMVIEEPAPAPPTLYVRLPDVEPQIDDDSPEPPPDVPKPPPRLVDIPFELEGSGFVEARYVPPAKGGPGPIAGYGNGDYIPMLTVAPDYPRRAAARGQEGYVIVEYTVDELGRVVDAQVIFAEPVQVFDRAALKAVQRYKYKPRVVDGQPVQVHGVRQKITFELAG